MSKQPLASTRSRKSHLPGYAFTLPVVVLVVGLIVYPMFYGGYISFFNTNLVTKWDFVGLKNYAQALTQSEFYGSVLLTFKFMILVVAGHFVLGFLLATLLNKKFPGRTFFRVIFLLPWLFPESVIGLLFAWILNPMYGVLNSVLKSLGLISTDLAWLGTADLAFASVVFVCIWKGFPLVMTMMLAGMQGISDDLYEASRIDGASAWRQFLHVTLPGLRPIIITTLVLDSVWWFKQFTTVYAMTAGGPGTATNLISLSIFRSAFTDLRFGKAAAWGILVLVICYLISRIQRAVLKDDE
ncbi:MAG: sugar ABC transporter permease [Arachnia sp.]